MPPTSRPARNKKQKPAGHDAFALMMATSSQQQQQQRQQQRQRKNYGSLVLCPAGCGKHFAEVNIHWHLDRCIDTTTIAGDYSSSKQQNNDDDPKNDDPKDTNVGMTPFDNTNPLEKTTQQQSPSQDDNHHHTTDTPSTTTGIESQSQAQFSQSSANSRLSQSFSQLSSTRWATQKFTPPNDDRDDDDRDMPNDSSQPESSQVMDGDKEEHQNDGNNNNMTIKAATAATPPPSQQQQQSTAQAAQDDDGPSSPHLLNHSQTSSSSRRDMTTTTTNLDQSNDKKQAISRHPSEDHHPHHHPRRSFSPRTLTCNTHILASPYRPGSTRQDENAQSNTLQPGDSLRRVMSLPSSQEQHQQQQEEEDVCQQDNEQAKDSLSTSQQTSASPPLPLSTLTQQEQQQQQQEPKQQQPPTNHGHGIAVVRNDKRLPLRKRKLVPQQTTNHAVEEQESPSSSQKSAAKSAAKANARSTSPPAAASKWLHKTTAATTTTTAKTITKNLKATTTTSSSPPLKKQRNNVFHHMMQQSRKLSQTSTNTEDPCVYFCLTNNATREVSLSRDAPKDVAWQSTVRVVDRTIRDEASTTTQSYCIGLCSMVPLVADQQGYGHSLSFHNNSNTPSTTIKGQPRRKWVRRHSRLSVPVLKSILQKSVRRRRPLPSVRIAMELADKSLGDLLRRLPIIVMEDSSLTPRLPFLVWMMMVHARLEKQNASNEGAAAQSESLPDSLIQKVLEIVFEISSCRLQDLLSDAGVEDRDSEEVSQVTIGFLLQRLEAHSLDSAEENSLFSSISKTTSTTIGGMGGERVKTDSSLADDQLLFPFTILLRACYGGMKGDIVMLKQYARIWYHRMGQDPSQNSRLYPLPESIAGTFQKSGTDSKESDEVHRLSDWKQVPYILHSSTNMETARSLIRAGITRLNSDDTCPEGVDFHCSNVMDHLLKNEWLVGLVSDLLFLQSEGDAEGDEVGPKRNPFPDNRGEREAWLQKAWKTCMWHRLSGVNRRLPLFGSANTNANNKANEKFHANPCVVTTWLDLVESECQEYQREYIRQRLAFR